MLFQQKLIQKIFFCLQQQFTLDFPWNFANLYQKLHTHLSNQKFFWEIQIFATYWTCLWVFVTKIWLRLHCHIKSYGVVFALKFWKKFHNHHFWLWTLHPLFQQQKNFFGQPKFFFDLSTYSSVCGKNLVQIVCLDQKLQPIFLDFT